eukprot:TRINITY_DN4218_c0_g1_i4.p1 TRINITY_DN4218_c0_g1~~TRINITY_DN4218_c0_g1_i4.p1  ORF type:complete len:477 (-),score=81.90 TRINITY_DN4218_c0_g1_i4:4-1434(-)
MSVSVSTPSLSQPTKKRPISKSKFAFCDTESAESVDDNDFTFCFGELDSALNLLLSKQIQSTDYTNDLQHSWAFWCEQDDRRDVQRGQSSKSYLQRLNKLTAFSQFEDFISNWNSIVAEQLPLCSALYLFKSGIRPLWEDRANSEGGKVVFNVEPKEDYLKALDMYLRINVLVISSQIRNKGVCGTSLTLRSTGSVISIWNSKSKDKDHVKTIIDIVSGHLGLKPKEFVYRRHKKSIRGNQRVAQKRQVKHNGKPASTEQLPKQRSGSPGKFQSKSNSESWRSISRSIAQPTKERSQSVGDDATRKGYIAQQNSADIWRRGKPRAKSVDSAPDCIIVEEPQNFSFGSDEKEDSSFSCPSTEDSPVPSRDDVCAPCEESDTDPSLSSESEGDHSSFCESGESASSASSENDALDDFSESIDYLKDKIEIATSLTTTQPHLSVNNDLSVYYFADLPYVRLAKFVFLFFILVLVVLFTL